MALVETSPATLSSTRRSLEWFNWNTAFRSTFDTICGLSGFVIMTFTLARGLSKGDPVPSSQRSSLYATNGTCTMSHDVTGERLPGWGRAEG